MYSETGIHEGKATTYTTRQPHCREQDKGAQMVLQAMDGRNGVYVYRRSSVQHMRISGFNLCSFLSLF